MKAEYFKQLNIVITEHDKVWSLCPHHKDTVRPNLSISLLERYYGRWKCWACGRNGCLTKDEMEKLNLKEHTIYKNGIKSLHTLWKQHTRSCLRNLEKFPLLKLGLARELNVSARSLDAFSVGYDGDAFTIPMYREDLGEYFRESGCCGIQRRFPNGSKRCVTGSRLGWMYPRYEIGDYYIFICEGFSDGVSVWDLGLQCLSRPHCRYIEGVEGLFEEGVLDGTETIIIIPDNDIVGKEGAEQLKDELEGVCSYDEGGFERDVDITIFSFDEAKDVRQLIALKGKDYVRGELGKYI